MMTKILTFLMSGAALSAGDVGRNRAGKQDGFLAHVPDLSRAVNAGKMLVWRDTAETAVGNTLVAVHCFTAGAIITTLDSKRQHSVGRNRGGGRAFICVSMVTQFSAIEVRVAVRSLFLNQTTSSCVKYNGDVPALPGFCTRPR